MKKIFVFLALFLLFASNISAKKVEKDDYVSKHSGSYELRIENERISQERLEAVRSKSENQNDLIIPYGGGNWRPLKRIWEGVVAQYPNYIQETNYWCGPASVKQAIQYINGSSASQSTYTSRMGTNSTDGTYVYKVVNELNYRQSNHQYIYTLASSLSDIWDAWGMIEENLLYDDAPVILHFRLEDLYLYNGRSGGHYITVIARYDDYLGPEWNYFTYVDSFNANYGLGPTLGEHNMPFIESVTAMMNKGRYFIW